MEETQLASLASSQLFLGSLFLQTSQLDSALMYTEKAIGASQLINDKRIESEAYVQLASIYRLQEQNGPAYDYLSRGRTLLDSINGAYITKLLQLQNIEFDQKIRLTELEKENELTKSRIRTYSLLAGLGIFVLVALLLYRNNRMKQKTNAVLEKTLTNLEATQSQLIQSEKLASLGQLAAGIAHEIKNPMNFINNFSELSLEYVGEIRQELTKLDKSETTEEIGALLNDVEDNLKKVHHHGTRADNIVTSMLMHSRGGSGKMESTDANALIKEYVNLAFHGMRAGKMAINVKIDLDLDDSLTTVDLNPEDFSRVILNLCKNAFDAMRTKGLQPEHQDYKPILKVSTKKIDNGVAAIDIEDNGPGVPETIKDKLFQPFFTTKKGTEGTGLGLSITHDIVKKHQGTITMVSQENAFTRFEIRLPITTKKTEA